jgi:hypothetical protein
VSGGVRAPCAGGCRPQRGSKRPHSRCGGRWETHQGAEGHTRGAQQQRLAVRGGSVVRAAHARAAEALARVEHHGEHQRVVDAGHLGHHTPGSNLSIDSASCRASAASHAPLGAPCSTLRPQTKPWLEGSRRVIVALEPDTHSTHLTGASLPVPNPSARTRQPSNQSSGNPKRV